MHTQHFGFFDSGRGGAITMAYMQEYYPQYTYSFIDDQAHAPYGNKSPEELFVLAQAMIKQLLKQRVDTIVVACHSISSNIFPELEAWAPVPLASINAALAQAIKESQPSNLAFLGTVATIQSGWWQQHWQDHYSGSHAEFYACPPLATAIDQNQSSEEIRTLLAQCLGEPNESIDTVALGCTHYPLAADEIQQFYPNATLVDARQALPSLLLNK